MATASPRARRTASSRRKLPATFDFDQQARTRWAEQPWLVAIVGRGSIVGSGFVIGGDRILTAAHVLQNLSVDDVLVHLQDGGSRRVEKYTPHRQHDIAVLTLDRAVEVEPIALGRLGELTQLQALQPIAVGFDGDKRTCLRHEVPGLEVTSDHELDHRMGAPEGFSGCAVSVLTTDLRRRVAIAVMSRGGRGKPVSIALRVDAVAKWTALRGVEMVDVRPAVPPEAHVLEPLRESLEANAAIAAAARDMLGTPAKNLEPLALARALVSRATDAKGDDARALCKMLRGAAAPAGERLCAFNALWVACGRFAVKGDAVHSNNPAGAEFGDAHRRRRLARFVLRSVSQAKIPGISSRVPFGATCFFSLPPGRQCLEAEDFVMEVVKAWWEEHRVKNKGGTASNPDLKTAMREELSDADCQLYIVYRAGEYTTESVRQALAKLGLPPDRCIAYGHEGPADTIFETLCNLVIDVEQEIQATNVHDSRR